MRLRDGFVRFSGHYAISGERDGPPMRAGYSVSDTGTGLQAALAISAAGKTEWYANGGNAVHIPN